MEWDDLVRSAGGTIFHSSVWADYVKAESSLESPRFIVLESEQGEFLGTALGFEQRSRHKWLAPFSGTLWFDALPATCSKDEMQLKEFLLLVEKHAYESRIVTLRVGSYASGDFSSQLRKLGFSTAERMEYDISLTVPEDQLWGSLGDKRRNQVRRAAKTGVVIHDLPAQEGIREYRRLRSATLERIREKGCDIIDRETCGERDPLDVLLESGYGRIICASVAGKVIGALVFSHFNELVYNHLAAYDRLAYTTQAPSLLLWETIKRYKSEGARVLSLGGVQVSAVQEDSPEHGVYMFKSKFMSTCRTCADGVKTLHGTVSDLIELGRKLRSYMDSGSKLKYLSDWI